MAGDPAGSPSDGPAGLRREDLLAELGHRVRALRTARGLSQQALARTAGLSPRFMAQLESGGGNISVANLAEVARALEVPLERLLAPAPGAGEVATAKGAAGEAHRLRQEIDAALAGRGVAELRGMLAALRAGQPPSPAESRPEPTVIALVGLRGAGKSTVGPLLAEALGRTFVELDEQIQELSGLAVSEIFEMHGEDYYRDAERRALTQLLAAGAPLVVAVSGGAVTDPALLSLLRERTLLVWLQATPQQHMQRVLSQGDRRPMADRPDAMAELRTLLRARHPLYAQARLTVDTSRATPEACVARLVAQLRRAAG
jgi:XRE family aerobic/anaerobic benzoate catabolism transcriptional regulator